MGFTIEHTNVYVKSRFLQRNIQMFTLSNGFYNETYKVFTTEHTNVHGESRVKETQMFTFSKDFHKGTYKYVYVESRFSQRNIPMFTLSHGFHKGTYISLRCLR